MGECDPTKNLNNITETEDIIDDLSILPLEKGDFAVCELCGNVCHRKRLYNRNTKYCSLRCSARARGKRNLNWKFTIMESTDHMTGLIPLEPFPQLQTFFSPNITDLQAGPIRQTASSIANSYEWKDELFGCDFLAAPVSLFKHAPLHDMWDNTFEGMKVEVKNTDEECNEKISDYFWVATILKVKGYMGLLRYEGFGSDDSKDFWVNLCCSEVHPVGWCATRGKPLIPVKCIEDKYNDWKKYLVKQLSGARTLPADFYSKLADNLKSRFSVGTVMEVVDKNRISQVKVASVYEILGKRLHIKYYDSTSEDYGFWCHEDSPLIHPVGWAFKVGHPLDATRAYCERVAGGKMHPNDATADMFNQFPSLEPPLFSVGMKLEAIDPLNLSSICVATVMRTLRDGYMMIRIDCYPAEVAGADWFCYHQRSPCIFPAGFCLANNIKVVPPNGLSASEFSWQQYLESTESIAAPQSCFAVRSHVVEHGFIAGMRLECVDLMDPRLVCVATISRVVADLLKVHFDGWGEEYDQWLWAHSTDMYPVGWCRVVGHRLEGPQQPLARPPRQIRRPRPPKPAKRRKKLPVHRNSQTPVVTEDSSQNSDTVELKSSSPNTSETSVDIECKPLENGNKRNISTEIDSDFDRSNSSLHLELAVVPDEASEHSDILEKADVILSEPSHTIPDEDTKCDDESNLKVIPRLVNNANAPFNIFNTVDPENWTPVDVAKFLTVNDCQPYCINFSNITGSKLLQLTKDEIIELLKMKVGPSLKIYDLIQQLKCKIRQPQSRLR